jgi:hypothetical protein
MYSSEPNDSSAVLASRVSNSARATPKSSTFTVPWLSSIRFDGLMSRWITRNGFSPAYGGRLYAASRADAVAAPNSHTTGTGTSTRVAAQRSIMPLASMASRYSITTALRPSMNVRSSTSTMLRWRSQPSRRASSRIRDATSSFSDHRLWRSLTATSREKPSEWMTFARYTLPKPPDAISRRNWKRRGPGFGGIGSWGDLEGAGALGSHHATEPAA